MTNNQSTDGRKDRKRCSRSKTGRKNPAASAALKKKWAEDPAYRDKQTKFNREVLPVGRRSRINVPDGMTWQEALPLWEQAAKNADIALAALERNGQIEFDLDIEEEQMARICLREALILALSPLRDQRLKTSALRTVLTYTKPKPARQTEVTLNSLEMDEWFQQVLADHIATSPSVVTNIA
jgi:hypothetical protein